MVRVWLEGLTEKQRAALRFDPTPRFKELPVGDAIAGHANRARNRDDGLPTPGVDGEQRERLRLLFIEAATGVLPPWRLRAFKAFVGSKNLAAAAREANMTRSSLRSAIFGQPAHKKASATRQEGAIAVVAAAVNADDEIKAEVQAIVDEPDTAPSMRGWFANIDNKPALVEPLALLLVLDHLADEKREVRVSKAAEHFPRNKISDCLRILAALAFAKSDGKVIRIHRSPLDTKDTAR